MVIEVVYGLLIPYCQRYQYSQHKWSNRFPFYIRLLWESLRIHHHYSFHIPDDKHNGIRYLTRKSSRMIQYRDYLHKCCLYYQIHLKSNLLECPFEPNIGCGGHLLSVRWTVFFEAPFVNHFE